MMTIARIFGIPSSNPSIKIQVSDCNRRPFTLRMLTLSPSCKRHQTALKVIRARWAVHLEQKTKYRLRVYSRVHFLRKRQYLQYSQSHNFFEQPLECFILDEDIERLQNYPSRNLMPDSNCSVEGLRLIQFTFKKLFLKKVDFKFQHSETVPWPWAEYLLWQLLSSSAVP